MAIFLASGFFRGEREGLPETGSSPGVMIRDEVGSDVHAHHLIGQQGDDAEHQMTEHFPAAAHPDMLRPELVLEATVPHRRGSVVQSLLKLVPKSIASSSFSADWLWLLTCSRISSFQKKSNRLLPT